MKYLCLRNCYTAGDRYYRAGEAYDLPDEMVKSDENFRLIEQTPAPEAVPAPEAAEATPAPSGDATGASEDKPPLYVSPKPRSRKRKVKPASAGE